MVKFKDLLPMPVLVNMESGSFEVHGLNLADVSKLMSLHFDTIASFINGDAIDFKSLAIQSPDVVAEIIAMASDAKVQEYDIKRLPFLSQVEALKTIWDLTVPDVKKLTELLSVVGTLKPKDTEPLNPLPSMMP